MTAELSEAILTTKRIKSGNQFQKYIDFIQFPYYRNIEIDTKIKFEFPLTVFIGQNGCGKSSCLHALYGAPKNYTPSKFWFETKVDPITYYNDEKKRHSFWYSFNGDKNEIKEVIKARIKRGVDPNYWETSRPLTWAGMQTRTNDKRDEPITKNVIYIDFRAELSAFDKYFFFGDIKGGTSKSKQEFIQEKSIQLKKVLSGEIPYYKTSTGKTNKTIRKLVKKELEWISFILGKTYESGIFLEHSFYGNDGYSVIFKTSHAEYSEAFAGSGEVAVLRLVMRVLDAVDYSLILLDEPEVSLHPGAQTRLKIFLLDQIKKKKHQIVITSHSPSIVKDLPKEAIKVFYQNPSNGRFIVKENLTPEEAFYHIEYPLDERKTLIVEDILAQEIITVVLNKIGEATKNLFNIKFNPGGETVIKKEFVTVFCRENFSKNYIIFDGDQKKIPEHYRWQNFSTDELTIAFLKKKLEEQTKEEIKFSVDGGSDGGNQKQQIELLKSYFDFYNRNVFYLPKQIPEENIWEDALAHTLIKLIVKDKDEISNYMGKLDEIKETKKKFVFISEILFGNGAAENVIHTQKQFTQKWLNQENDDYIKIKDIIESIVAHG